MLSHWKNLAILIVWLTGVSLPLASQEIALRGQVTDPQGNGLSNATVQLVDHDSGGKGQALRQTTSGPEGRFEIKAASAGQFDIRVDAEGFRQVIVTQSIHPRGNPEITIRMGQISSRVETVTVTADVDCTDVLSPDPAEKVFVREDLLDANPGRPGAPVIPD
jgi:Carboxypeptidase regulatory-like domain